ncbi:unnamed protein product [Sphagnum jensenii]
MALALLELLEGADAIVTYNGNKYDLPKIKGHLMLMGLNCPPPPTSIDLIKTIKSMGFVMARLAYIAPLLDVGAKMKHEGFNLWRAVLEGDSKAQKPVSRVSKVGNDKHNPGQPLHWSRGKSTDHGDCIIRHQIQFNEIDQETNEYHAAAVAWRALAQLQLLEESKNVDLGLGVFQDNL